MSPEDEGKRRVRPDARTISQFDQGKFLDFRNAILFLYDIYSFDIYEERSMRWVMITVGVLILALGLILSVLPIPFGLLLVCVALFILIPTVPGLDGRIARLRKRFIVLDRAVSAITRRLPVPYRRILRRTEPRI